MSQDKINLADVSPNVLKNIVDPNCPIEIPEEEMDTQFLQEWLNFNQTPIPSAHELKESIKQVWSNAMKTYGYRCIKELTFLNPRISTLPYYQTVLERRKTSSIPLPLLDVGTCFGNDIRKLIIDGYPRNEVVGLDIQPAFWKYGLQLFQDQKSLNVTFLAGNVMDDEFLSVTSGATINHLKDYFAFVYLGSVLHLLSKELVSSLLSKIQLLLKPGGVLFGRTVGSNKPVQLRGNIFPESSQLDFLHSSVSLKQTLEELGYINVKIDDVHVPEQAQQLEMHFLLFYAEKPSISK